MTCVSYAGLRKKLQKFLESRRWFRMGWCHLCGKWSLYILDSEAAHEECWLDTK